MSNYSLGLSGLPLTSAANPSKTAWASLLPEPLLKDCLKSARLKPNLRAEDLSLADFARLVNRVNQYRQS